MEVAIAAVLPCFWVCKIVGESIYQQAQHNNPYLRWIETYSGEDFTNSVNAAIQIFDDVAMLASDTVRADMLDAFYKSTVFEWHFWNDAYSKKVFDEMT